MLEEILHKKRAFFSTGKTKEIKFRKRALKRFHAILERRTTDICAAVEADFGKSFSDVYTTEIALCLKEISFAYANLNHWTKKQRVKTNWINFPGKSYCMSEPLGVCLVISPWNYPVLLALSPIISAIAAGNTVVLKPSELTPNTALALEKLVEEFDKDLVAVVRGDKTIAQNLLQLPFDKIFFTGSTHVGKIVYEAAAKHLTPVTLELGGKSPAIITPSAAIDRATQRLVWAKFLNAGQTCIAPDYVIVHRSKIDSFLQAVQKWVQQQDYSLKNGNYVRIITTEHLNRLSALIENTSIFLGGKSNTAEQTLEPTVLYPVTWTDKIMEEEIFGPVLPVLVYDDFDVLLETLKTKDKPLAAYLFSRSKREINSFETQLSFGNGAINDAVMQIANIHLPFGGIGKSGIGTSHGYFGFRTFSHEKALLKKPFWFELPVKYGKASRGKLRFIRWISKL